VQFSTRQNHSRAPDLTGSACLSAAGQSRCSPQRRRRRSHMSHKLVVIDNGALSGKPCKQFIQFVVRHTPPHILGHEGYHHYILCPELSAPAIGGGPLDFCQSLEVRPTLSACSFHEFLASTDGHAPEMRWQKSDNSLRGKVRMLPPDSTDSVIVSLASNAIRCSLGPPAAASGPGPSSAGGLSGIWISGGFKVSLPEVDVDEILRHGTAPPQLTRGEAD